jgi:ribose transport system substrate-binding protein
MKVQRALRALLAALLLSAALVAAAGCGSGNSNDSTPVATSGGGGAPAAARGSAYDVVRKEVDCPCTTPKLEGDTYSADLGGGHVVRWKKGEKLKIAEFDYGQQVPYNVALAKGVHDAAEANGAEITMFDAQINPATQRNQIQNALASRRFNAMIVVAVDGDASCQQVSRDIPAADIPVVVLANEVCGRDAESGADLWNPGTVAYVGEDNPALYRGFMDKVLEQIGGRGEAIAVVGPPAVSVTKVFTKTVKETAAANPDFKIADVAYTDFTSASALTRTQNLLSAHPDADVIVMMYGGQLPGVVQAVKQAGKSDQVKVFDIGGSGPDKAAVLAGDLAFTAPFYPQTEGYCAADMLAALHAGQPVPRVVVNMCHRTAGSPNTQNVSIVTQETAASFEPQG